MDKRTLRTPRRMRHPQLGVAAKPMHQTRTKGCGTRQTFSNRLLETLKDTRRISFFGFSDQDVEVLRHHHVTDNFKLVFVPDLLEDAKKDIRACFVPSYGLLLAESNSREH